MKVGCSTRTSLGEILQVRGSVIKVPGLGGVLDISILAGIYLPGWHSL